MADDEAAKFILAFKKEAEKHYEKIKKAIAKNNREEALKELKNLEMMKAAWDYEGKRRAAMRLGPGPPFQTLEAVKKQKHLKERLAKQAAEKAASINPTIARARALLQAKKWI